MNDCALRLSSFPGIRCWNGQFTFTKKRNDSHADDAGLVMALERDISWTELDPPTKVMTVPLEY